MEKYLLWSGRLNGWLTSAGTYMSTSKDARRFDHDEAIQYCKAHYRNGMSEYGMLPVAESDVKAIAS